MALSGRTGMSTHPGTWWSGKYLLYYRQVLKCPQCPHLLECMHLYDTFPLDLGWSKRPAFNKQNVVKVVGVL